MRTASKPCTDTRCVLPADHDGHHRSGRYHDAFGFHVFDEWGSHPKAETIVKLVGEGRAK